MDRQVIASTGYSLPGVTNFYKGSVRDVYEINNKYLAMVATDRISAFDVILPITIPSKGQVLSQIAEHFLNSTGDIVPNWFINSPDPNVIIGYKCVPYKIEVVVRGYLVGHAWRVYARGERLLCGVKLPNGLRENQAFIEPIITPATHAEIGRHDEDITAEDIIKKGLIPASDWQRIENYALALFQRGSTEARKRGLLLVDTKYEFGIYNDDLYLIDEIHTPDSSRYFYADGYENRLKHSEHQHQLSKEFVREWLFDHGFQGLKGQKIPAIPEEFVSEIEARYIELYEVLTGKKFIKASPDTDINQRILANLRKAIGQLDV